MAKRSFLKTVFYTGLGAFLLLLAVALSVPLWFKVDHYRPEIEKKLSDKLHRSVTLGELQLHILPLPAISAASIAVADDPAFSTEPMFTSKAADIRIPLMSLLKKPLPIQSISVNEGVLNIRKDAAGRNNLARFTDALAEPAAADKTASAAPGDSAVAIELSSLSLRHFTVNYAEPGKPPVTVPLELSLTGFGQASSRLELTVQATTLTFKGHLDAKGLKGDFSAKPLQLQDLQPLLRVAGSELPAGLISKGSLSVNGSADLQFDHPDDAVISGGAEMKDGEIGLGRLSAPLTAVNFTATVRHDLIEVKKLSLKFLQSQLAGELQVKNWLDHPVLTFNLTSERLELGEISSHLKSAAPGPGAVKKPAAPAGGDASPPLEISGTLEAAQGGYDDFHFTRLKASLSPASLNSGAPAPPEQYNAALSLGSSQLQESGAEPMLTFKQADLRLQFRSLQADDLAIDEITVDDAVLNLRRDAKQQLNLASWLDQRGSASGAGAAGPAPRVRLAKVNRLLLRAFVQPNLVELPVSLTLARFGQPDCELDATLGATRLHYGGLLDAKRLQGDVRLDPLGFDDINTVLKIAGTSLPAGLAKQGTLTAAGALDVNFSNPDAARYKINADLRDGALTLDMLTAPLTHVDLSAAVSNDAINVSRIAFGLLKTKFDGQAAALDWRKQPAISFSLNADQFEIGDLTTLVKSGPSNSGSGGGSFTANGNLKVGKGGFGVFRFSDFSSQLQINPGLVHLNGVRAQFFSGTLTADAKVMTQTGRFSFGAQLTGIDLAAFMKGVAGSPYMSGTADVAANGEGPVANWQSLTGYAKVSARNGQISHFDLLDKINKAFSVTGLSQITDKDLKYDSLTSDLHFANAGAHADSILLNSPLTEVRGTGDIKFSNRIDIRGTSHLTQARSLEMVHQLSELSFAYDNEKRLMIPFSATGPADNPSVSVDAQTLLKEAGKAAAKKKAGDFLGGLLGGKKKSAP